MYGPVEFSLSARNVFRLFICAVRFTGLDASFQERTRDIEDRIGDALHERLVERFVEQSKRSVELPRDAPSGPFAELGELLEAQQREGERARERWTARLVEAAHEALEVDDEGAIRFEGETVGRLARGRELSAPEVLVTVPEDVGKGEDKLGQAGAGH